MTASVLRSGTQIALEVRDSTANCTLETQALKTLADLLAALAKDPPRAFPMLRTTSALLVAYLNDPPEKIWKAGNTRRIRSELMLTTSASF
jgi:hypothetical protein